MFSTSTSILQKGRLRGTTARTWPVGALAPRFPALQSFALNRAERGPTPARRSRYPDDRPALYEVTRALPIVSPHGHCDPAGLADDAAFGDPATELVTKDHYVLRLLYSQGVPIESLGVRAARRRTRAGTAGWSGVQFARTFTSSGAHRRSSGWSTRSRRCWASTPLRPRPPTPCTTRSRPASPPTPSVPAPCSSGRALSSWRRPTARWAPGTACTLRHSGWSGTVVPTFRPDDVVDPDRPGFRSNVATLGRLTDTDTSTWKGYLDAIRLRRAEFIAAGATASDHGHPSPATADLVPREAEDLFARVLGGRTSPGDAELFRGQMLVEMAGMSMDDGLVLQLHTGAWRDHNPWLAARFGPDQGADMPRAVDYVSTLKPLLDRFGNEAADCRGVHTGRDHLQPGARPAGRPLPRPPPGTAVVVLRQPRGDPPVLPSGRRDGRLRQHRRVQRRRPIPADHPRPPRRGAAAERRLPGRARGGAPVGRGRGGRPAADLAYNLARRAFRVGS